MSAFESKTRTMEATVTIAGYPSDRYSKYVKDFKIVKTVASGDCLTFGTANSSTLTLNLMAMPKRYAKDITTGSTINIVLSASAWDAESETIVTDTQNVGTYTVKDIKLSRFGLTGLYSAEITAYDILGYGTMIYKVPTTQKTVTEILNDICTSMSPVYLYGLELGGGWEDSDNVTIPANKWKDNLTVREVIGLCAGLLGGCAYISNANKLCCHWFDTAAESYQLIPSDLSYLDGISYTSGGTEITSEDTEETEEEETDPDYNTTIKIEGVRSGYCDDPIAIGTDVGDACITIDNIFMTSKYLQTCYDKAYGLEYCPIEVKWRGNPAAGLFSKINVEDTDGSPIRTYLMEREMVFDGGYYEIARAYPPDVENLPSKGTSGETPTPTTTGVESFECICVPTDMDGNALDPLVAYTSCAIATYSFLNLLNVISVQVPTLLSGQKLKIPIPWGYTPADMSPLSGDMLPSFGVQLLSVHTNERVEVRKAGWHEGSYYSDKDIKASGASSLISSNISQYVTADILVDGSVSIRSDVYDSDSSNIVISFNHDEEGLALSNVVFTFIAATRRQVTEELMESVCQLNPQDGYFYYPSYPSST